MGDSLPGAAWIKDTCQHMAHAHDIHAHTCTNTHTHTHTAVTHASLSTPVLLQCGARVLHTDFRIHLLSCLLSSRSLLAHLSGRRHPGLPRPLRAIYQMYPPSSASPASPSSSSASSPASSVSFSSSSSQPTPLPKSPEKPTMSSVGGTSGRLVRSPLYLFSQLGVLPSCTQTPRSRFSRGFQRRRLLPQSGFPCMRVPVSSRPSWSTHQQSPLPWSHCIFR